MNSYVKSFFQRGLMFAGFGPIVLAIVYAILAKTIDNFSLSGSDVCLGIISTYILAFIQAGVTVFNQIEHWSITKSMFFHFIILYISYSVCYLINSWIPFNPMILFTFTLIFIFAYLIIWFIVYFSVKSAARKLNKCIK